MATYNNAATTSTEALPQHGNDSCDCLPKYEVDYQPTYDSSAPSTTSSASPSLMERLKARIAASKEARDSRASLYELWESKLPRHYAKQTYPTVESYPPHRAEYARQLRHQSWYPHYDPAAAGSEDVVELDSAKVQELKTKKRHQSWYPHYKTQC